MALRSIGIVTSYGRGTPPSDSIDDIIINGTVDMVVSIGPETTTSSAVDPNDCSPVFWELL